jgi:hypothetical protein
MSFRLQRRPAFLVGLIALLTLLVGPAGVVALQSSGNHVSPATGHAEVIAHGVAAMPDARVAWKVSTPQAQVIDDEPLGNYPLGFAYAAGDPIVVNDYGTGAQTELAPGEAVFIAGGATQQHASLTESSATYQQIALVGEADAPNPSNVFDAPSGSRAINLVRDVLTDGESTTIAESGAPALVSVISGTVSVASSGGQQSVKAGGAAVLSGDLTITQTGSKGAIVLVAQIGDQIPPAPRFSGTITLQIFGCPSGTTVESLPPAGSSDQNPCKAITDQSSVALKLKTPNSKSKSLADAEPVKGQAGSYIWRLLPFGDYEVQAPSTIPSGYGQVLFVGSDNAILKKATTTLSRANPDVVIALYLLTADNGKITATVMECPPGMTEETFDAAACGNPTLSLIDIKVSSDALPNGDLTVKDTVPDNPKYIWEKLPVSTNGEDGATYTLTQTVLPPGFDDYLIDGAKGGSGQPWTVTLTAENPEATVTFYDFQSGAEGGTVTVDALVCSSSDSAAADCTRPDGGPVGLSGIVITGPQTLTEGNASQNSGSPFTWSKAAYGDYTMVTGDLIAPEGYTIAKVETTPEGSDPANGFTLSQDNPTVNIVVLLVPSGGNGTPVAQGG